MIDQRHAEKTNVFHSHGPIFEALLAWYEPKPSEVRLFAIMCKLSNIWPNLRPYENSIRKSLNKTFMKRQFLPISLMDTRYLQYVF